ncbi:hypothetical protein H1R20_g13904, partial [Candolleomyces eurysporus]
MLILNADMGSSDGDNNDGITILDVTVPRNPAYCFVFLNAEDVLPAMTPLTAAQYLRSYYPAPKRPLNVDEMTQMSSEWDCLEVIANLDDMPLIPIATLAKLVTYSTEIDAFRRQSVLSADDMTRLTAVLKGATHPNAVVDLSRLPLTANQILSVLEELRDFKRLDVSYSQAVDNRVFLHILRTYKSLMWINILHCPISMDDLKELMTNDPQRFRSIETILHPAFLTGKLPADFPKAFRITYITNDWPRYNYVTLPFFSADQLVQNIFDILANLHSSYRMPSLATVASSHLAQGQSWYDRAIQIVPGRNLDDDPSTRSYDLLPYAHQKEGYQLVVQANCRGKPYGILAPMAPEQSEHTDSDIIGMDSFLKRLEDEGYPATDAAAVKGLLELCANMELTTMEQVLNIKRYLH